MEVTGAVGPLGHFGGHLWVVGFMMSMKMMVIKRVLIVGVGQEALIMQIVVVSIVLWVVDAAMTLVEVFIILVVVVLIMFWVVGEALILVVPVIKEILVVVVAITIGIIVDVEGFLVDVVAMVGIRTLVGLL